VLAAPCVDPTALGTCTSVTTPTDAAATAGQTATPGGGGLLGSIASSAWDAVCKAFGEAAVTALKAFAEAFASFPSINPQDAGIQSVYAISLGIAAVVAAVLVLLQIARTVITHDGAGLAHAITGLGKSALAFLLTLTISTAAITAANELTQFIIDRTFTDTAGLQAKLTALFVLSAAEGTSSTLLMVLAVIAILLVLVLWFELLLGNAALALLIGTSPIAAAGQTSALTAGWWPKLVSATAQLIILKPVIALVFAVGFSLAGNSTDLAGNMTGLLVLLLAVLAWPAIARFFTFASISMGGGTGLAALLGFAAGRVNGAASGQTAPGSPEGATGDDFASAASQRSLATHASRASAAGGAGAGGSAAAGGAATAAGPAAPVVLLAAAAVDAAQRGANALTGRMEQTARHAGLDGANAHPYPAGYPRHAPVPLPRPSGGGGGGAGAGGEGTTTASPDGPGDAAAPDLAWPGHQDAPDLAATAPGTEAGGTAASGTEPSGADAPRPGGSGQVATGSADDAVSHEAGPSPDGVAPTAGDAAQPPATDGPAGGPAQSAPAGGGTVGHAPTGPAGTQGQTRSSTAAEATAVDQPPADDRPVGERRSGQLGSAAPRQARRATDPVLGTGTADSGGAQQQGHRDSSDDTGSGSSGGNTR
jgi:hypothetical protein